MMNAAKETAVRRTQGQGKGEELSDIAEQPKNMPTENSHHPPQRLQGSAIMMQLPQGSVMQAHTFQFFKRILPNTEPSTRVGPKTTNDHKTDDNS